MTAPVEPEPALPGGAHRAASLIVALLLLPAAAFAGPRVKPVAPEPDARYALGTAARADVPDAWWTSFGDPALDALVVEALEANHDLGGAQARIHSAQGVAVQNLAPLLPTASFDVGLNASPSANAANQIAPQLQKLFEDLAELSENIPGQPAEEEEDTEEDPDVTWNGSALFNFGLNIDLGRSAFAFRAAQLDAAAARGDRDGVARVLVQQVVGAWLDVRTARARIALVEQQIATNEILLDITRRRFVGGDSRGLDVLQQQQQLAATRALLPTARQLLRLRSVQLATLLGRDPSNPQLPDSPELASLPALPPNPGVGTPRDLVDLRPDVRAAQARYLAAQARVVSGALSFAPTFRLTGNLGWGLRWFNEWDSWETWGFGAAVSVPLFGGGQRHGAMRQANGAADAAAHTLSQAILTAQGEVESALAREDTEGERLAALQEVLTASRTAYEESTRQYAGGLVNYLTVLTSLASLQSSELNHLQAQRDLLGARVDLHTALGTPWAGNLSATGADR